MSARKSRKVAEPFSMAGVTGYLAAAFPGATAAHVAAMTGIPAATVDNWMRGRASASAAHLGTLMAVFGPAFAAAAFPAYGRGANDGFACQVADELERVAARLRRAG